MKKDIKLLGSTWYEIDRQIRGDNVFYLMENQIYGDYMPCIIIDKDNKVILEDVYNGFEELNYC